MAPRRTGWYLRGLVNVKTKEWCEDRWVCILDFYIVRGQEVVVLLQLQEGEVAVEGR
jgi:hypothetical protein